MERMKKDFATAIECAKQTISKAEWKEPGRQRLMILIKDIEILGNVLVRVSRTIPKSLQGTGITSFSVSADTYSLINGSSLYRNCGPFDYMVQIYDLHHDTKVTTAALWLEFLRMTSMKLMGENIERTSIKYNRVVDYVLDNHYASERLINGALMHYMMSKCIIAPQSFGFGPYIFCEDLAAYRLMESFDKLNDAGASRIDIKLISKSISDKIKEWIDGEVAGAATLWEEDKGYVDDAHYSTCRKVEHAKAIIEISKNSCGMVDDKLCAALHDLFREYSGNNIRGAIASLLNALGIRISNEEYFDQMKEIQDDAEEAKKEKEGKVDSFVMDGEKNHKQYSMEELEDLCDSNKPIPNNSSKSDRKKK